jgi:hypothetical protein
MLRCYVPAAAAADVRRQTKEPLSHTVEWSPLRGGGGGSHWFLFGMRDVAAKHARETRFPGQLPSITPGILCTIRFDFV